MNNVNIVKKNIFSRHKIMISFMVIVLLGGGYYTYKNFFTSSQVATRYVTETAQKSTLTVSVTSSGQVSDLNKIELKPAAGTSNVTITETKVKNGDRVKEGQVIAIVDQKNSESSLRQAQASLASAKANYDKVLAGTSKSDIKSAENSIRQAELSYQNALTSLENTKKNTAVTIEQNERTIVTTKANGVSSVESKRDSEINSIQDKINSAKTTLDSIKKIFDDSEAEPYLGVKNSSITIAKGEYNQAIPLVDTANLSLNKVKTSRSDSDFSKASNDTQVALNKIASSLSNLYNALLGSMVSIQFTQTELDSYKSTVSSLLSSTNSGVYAIQTAQQNLVDAIRTANDNNVTAQNNLDSSKVSASQSLISAQSQIESSKNSLQSAKDNLAKLLEPAEAQEVASARSQYINAGVQLEQAQNTYNNNIITAPFDGVIASIDVQKGAQVSASTIIGTIITQQKIAEVSFNEVDASKLKVGDKAILTFDAIDGLSISGKVAEVDALGTVSSGVVTYGTKITFDTQDERVKSDMSVNVEVITAVQTDVIVVSNAAVKTENDSSYVQILDSKGQPQNITVKIGIANDTYTEITEGVNEGDKVITQTISSASSQSKTTNSSSGFNFQRLTGGGGPGR